MKLTTITEEHYIIIGSNRYQTVFDAKCREHDILIRGLFKWDSINNGKIIEIDFMLDNLSTVKTPFLIDQAKWCSNQNRIELHIIKKAAAELRTQRTMSILNGFDLENGKEIELVLRVNTAKNHPDECQKFELPRPNEHEMEGISPTGINQEDKDGSILIGSIISKP